MFEWQPEYELGVNVIDSAHKRLFSIVSRIMRNFTDSNFEKNKTTCIEAIKYLESYTIMHFAEEEEYMRSIKYPGFKLHKRIHDNMRDVVVPALSKEVTSSCYSKESIEHFVGVCAGWLTAHIMIEDQAISGRAQSKWVRNAEEGIDKLESIVQEVSVERFHMPVSVISKNYDGHKLSSLFCYRSLFRDSYDTLYTVITAVEKTVLVKVLTNIVNEKAMEIEQVMKPMVSEVVKGYNERIAFSFLGDNITVLNSDSMYSDDFYRSFAKVYPEYSTLWRTDGGFFGLCISKKESALL